MIYRKHDKDWYYTLEEALKFKNKEVEIEKLKHITDNTIIASDIVEHRNDDGDMVSFGILRYIGDRNNPENNRIFLKYSANAKPIFSYYLSSDRYDEVTGRIYTGILDFLDEDEYNRYLAKKHRKKSI